jgi:hypothetical protein
MMSMMSDQVPGERWPVRSPNDEQDTLQATHHSAWLPAFCAHQLPGNLTQEPLLHPPPPPPPSTPNLPLPPPPSIEKDGTNSLLLFCGEVG